MTDQLAKPKRTVAERICWFLLALLAVIFLISLMFPAGSQYHENQYSRTAMLCTNLAIGCQAYYSEYNTYPPYQAGECKSDHVIHTAQEWETLCTILNGNQPYAGGGIHPPIPGANPRNICFFQAKPSDTGNRYGGSPNVVIDPYSLRKDVRYFYAQMIYDEPQGVTIPDLTKPKGTIPLTGVAVWSKGKDDSSADQTQWIGSQK